jgi:hypothetical protein
MESRAQQSRRRPERLATRPPARRPTLCKAVPFYQFCRRNLRSFGIAPTPAILEPDVAAIPPAQLLERIEESGDAGLTLMIGALNRSSIQEACRAHRDQRDSNCEMSA